MVNGLGQTLGVVAHADIPALRDVFDDRIVGDPDVEHVLGIVIGKFHALFLRELFLFTVLSSGRFGLRLLGVAHGDDAVGVDFGVADLDPLRSEGRLHVQFADTAVNR